MKLGSGNVAHGFSLLVGRATSTASSSVFIVGPGDPNVGSERRLDRSGVEGESTVGHIASAVVVVTSI